jgi:hypothetical protein
MYLFITLFYRPAMKKYLPVFFFLFQFETIPAQVVFCPPGAEWRATFTESIWSQSLDNSSIIYSGDSIVGQDTFKILRQNKFYGQCNTFHPFVTLIKQKGDTVFFKNVYTSQVWQIMYNYDCLPGQGWTTSYVPDGGGVRTYTFMVDSVNSISINQTPLRQLFVTYKYQYNLGVQTYTASIKERLGWGFLFTYRNNSGACDGDNFVQTLCYSDSTFGEYKLSEYPCNYSNPTGIKIANTSLLELQIFPNPVQNLLVINSNVKYSYKLTDLIGLHLNIESTATDHQTQFDFQPLPRGIYFLKVFEKDKWICTQKIIKQ